MTKQFLKVLEVLKDGNPVKKEDFNVLEGQVELYRLSAYMWNIKSKLGGKIKAIKNGKNIVAYQLLNPNDMKKHLLLTENTPIAKAANKKETPKPSETPLLNDGSVALLDPSFDEDEGIAV